MQRHVYRIKAGNIKNLKITQEELPAPGPGEVTVAVKTIGLNFADVFAIWGLYSATPKGEFIPGLEYAGEIAAVGEGVTSVKVGDPVMGVTRFGAYASHLNIEAQYVIPLPTGWSFAEGAAYLVQVLTAYYALVHLGDLRENANVLIHSAAGGVGLLANRIAKKYNAFTIGTVGSERKIAKCKEEGYDRVIVRGKDFAEQLDRALEGRPLNLVMETIGGKILEIGYEKLAAQGRMVVYSSARYATRTDRPNYLKLMWQFFTRPKIDPQTMTQENKGLLGFNLIYLYEQAELMHQLLEELKELDLPAPFVGHTFDFEELPDAIRTFQSGKTMGKVVIRVA
jgi:NADPH:quinone reductase-like Zn-dependent oxidoreductase